MLRTISLEDAERYGLIPQAIVKRPVSFFAKVAGADVVKASDDLDHYEGTGLILNEETPFAIKHYRGEPSDTATIFLSHLFSNVDEITAIVARVVNAFGLSPDAIA